jgi:hypothetical protein
MMEAVEQQAIKALRLLVPASFTDAQSLYGLRDSDADGWKGRTQMQNAAWLVEILAERLRDEVRFSNELTYMARSRAQELRRKDDASN